MNDKLLQPTTISADDEPVRYIETPRRPARPERIDTLLAKRMREFLLARRQKVWREEGR